MWQGKPGLNSDLQSRGVAFRANFFLLSGAKMLRHIRDVLNEDVCRLFCPYSSFLDAAIQSCLLVIDAIILPGVVSTDGQDLVQSLLKLKNVYQPVPAPEFVPADFGEASRIQHQINVALTVLCNCENSSFSTRSLPWSRLSAFERTLPQLQEMVELGGLKIKKVHATR